MSRPVQLQLIRDPDALARAVREFLLAKEAAGRSPNTLDFYRHTLTRFADFAPGWPPTPGACQAYLFALRREGLSEHSVASYYRGLRAFLNWCVRRHLLNDNPLTELDRPSEPDPAPRAIPQLALRAIFQAMAEWANSGDLLAIRDHAMFRLTYAAGLRATEAARLRVGDVDLERHSVIVHGKGNRRRECFYGRRTRLALRRWLAVRYPGSEWLFPSSNVRNGLRPLTRQGVRLAWRRWCERAGVGPYRVHDLRHSYVIHAMRRGIDPGQVSAQAGHSDVAFTLRVYGKATDEQRRLSHLEHCPGDEV